MLSGNAQSRDTGRRRDADAARVRAVAADRFTGFQRLHFYTLPLHLPEGTPLHSREASRAARMVAETVFGSLPARWKLERGRGGGLHLHAVAPLPPVAVAQYADARPVWNLRGLLAYLGKPADARLCRPRLTPDLPDSATRARQFRAALDEQAQARAARHAQGHSRLPAVSGWTGRRPARPAALLTARCALAYALLTVAHLIAQHGALTVRPARIPARRAAAPFLTCTAPRSPYRPRARAPDRPTQGLAR